MQTKSDTGVLVMLSGLLVFAVWLRLKNPVLEIYFEHRYLVIAAMTGVLLLAYGLLRHKFKDREESLSMTEASEDEDAVLLGKTKAGKRVWLKHKYRAMHAQVVGTTNAGKTESVILPLAVDDIKRGRGLILIDGKSDRSLLNKLYAYAKRHGRADDVKVLSLCDVEISHTFNPLLGGSPLEVTERVFRALTFENEYYKTLQYGALLHTLLIFEAAGVGATPARVIEFLKNPSYMMDLSNKTARLELISWATDFLKLSNDDREERTSGLISQLQLMAVGDTASIFNVENSDVSFDEALKNNHIIYCQLPVLKIPTLGKAIGKFILQGLQGAISSRHLGRTEGFEHFSIYLDDFTEYLTEGFVSLLNKSRSAKVSVVFAHQALGDLAGLGDSVKNSILTNANLKFIMRMNESESAEYFSGVIGTKASEKLTERQRADLLGTVKTGESSARVVEEYKFHPNLFKQDMGPGEAVVLIPHERGSTPVRVSLNMLPNLDAPVIPMIHKSEPVGLGRIVPAVTATVNTKLSALDALGGAA